MTVEQIMRVEQQTVFGVLVFCGASVMYIPVLHYLIAGWAAKRKDIMDGFDADARDLYFKMFGRTAAFGTKEVACREFERFHSRWYGRRFFIGPVLLLFLITVTGVVEVAVTGLDHLGYLTIALPKLPVTAMAAFAGAYLWVVDDLILRARRLDMAPSDLMWASLRFVIAIPMGYCFARILTPSLAPFVSFALGAFPLTALQQMLRRLANKNLGQDPEPEATADDIIKLQGINRAIVDRLSIEDINTVTQIAYCDPVRLIMRSSLSFNFITDVMNEALAWMYLQSDLDLIRPLGIRGAIEISCLCREFDDVNAIDPKAQAAHLRAVAAFPLIAAALKQDPATLQIVFRQIAEDPFTVFLGSLWKLFDQELPPNA
jgi:hypothetical protein